jgi:hypothetical protein
MRAGSISGIWGEGHAAARVDDRYSDSSHRDWALLTACLRSRFRRALGLRRPARRGMKPGRVADTASRSVLADMDRHTSGGSPEE